jgi:hypothetical protein
MEEKRREIKCLATGRELAFLLSFFVSSPNTYPQSTHTRRATKYFWLEHFFLFEIEREGICLLPKFPLYSVSVKSWLREICS